MPANVDTLLQAESIAIVGASDRNPYSVNIFDNLVSYGFPADRVFPVNPRRSEVFGRPCWNAVSQIEEHVDVAVIATPASTVPEILADCADKAVRACVVVSEGFAESGSVGKELQERSRSIAVDAGMSLCGPNTLGLVAPSNGLAIWAGRTLPALRRGGVTAVFQSSGLLNLLLRMGGYRNLGFRLGVSVGNGIGLRAVDYLRFAVNDPQTEVVVTHLEAVPEPDEFIGILKDLAEVRKPVIVLHYGKSARGQRAVTSHTGALASPSAVWSAVLDQFGAIAVADIDQALETTLLVSMLGKPAVIDRTAARGVGLFTISGGDCTMLADLAETAAVRLADLPPAVVGRIQEELRTEAPLGNPLDVRDIGRSHPQRLITSLEALFSEEDVGLVAGRLDLPHSPGESQRALYSDVAALARKHKKPFIVWSRASESLDKEWINLFSDLGVPFLSSYHKGLQAIGHLQGLGCTERSKSLEDSNGTESQLMSEAHTELASKDSGTALLVPDAEIKEVLARYGLNVVSGVRATSLSEAQSTAARVGFPVVLKLDSPDVAHKTEVGGVALDIRGAEELAVEYERLLASVATRAPGADVAGVLVEPMIRGGVEMIIGFYSDPQVGKVVLLGTGGLFTEVFADRVLRLPPLESEDVLPMILRLRGSKLLSGFRGEPPADIGALVDAVVAVSRMAVELDDIAELDINPLRVGVEGEGVVALDVMATRMA